MDKVARTEWIAQWKKNKEHAIREGNWVEVDRINRIISLAEKGAEVMVVA